MLPSKKIQFQTALVGIALLCLCMVLLKVIFRVPTPSAVMQTTSPHDALIGIVPGSSVRRELARGAKGVRVIRSGSTLNL